MVIIVQLWTQYVTIFYVLKKILLIISPVRVLIIGFLHTVEPTTLPHMQFTQNYNLSCPDSSHSCQDVLCSDYKVALLNQKSESDGGQNFDNRQAVSL